MAEEFEQIQMRLVGEIPWIYADFCALVETELTELFNQSKPPLTLQEKAKFRRLHKAGGFPIVDLRAYLELNRSGSIDSAFTTPLQFRIPTATSSTSQRWPEIFVRAEGNFSTSVDWWIKHSVDGEAEVSVMSVDAGWINIIQEACTVRVFRDQTHESSAGQSRPDATLTKLGSLVLKHEAKYSADQLPLAVSELLTKMFPGVEELFPQDCFDIIGVTSSASVNQIHKLSFNPMRKSFSESLISEYNVNNIEDRVRFLVDIIKLCRWIIAVKPPNKKFHLVPGRREKTSNGHSITWCREGLLKEFQSFERQLRSNRGGFVSDTQLGHINFIHSLGLPHVERGYPIKSLRATVMITRIGQRVQDALVEGKITIQQIMTDVRKGLDELHKEGFAHCDLRVENVFVDSDGAFLDDLEYLTPINEPPPLHVKHKHDLNSTTTALELDVMMLQKFDIALTKF
eukprot:gene16746-22907_t